MTTEFDSDELSPHHETRTILHEGYLHKKGQINRSWKKRYFILYSDKKLAYFTNQELTNHAAINEINLSTVEELSLLPFARKSKKNRASVSISTTFTDLFANKTPTDSCSVYTLNTMDLEDDEEDVKDAYDSQEDDDLYQHHDLYVDAPINTQYVCSRRHAFALITEKRDYWLCCNNSQELNEWIIHLKYAIFGKLILNGYLTKKTKKKLKTKWKRRYIEIYESKILRIYKSVKKTKVKQQIDLDAISISKIKCVDADLHLHAFPIEIYDKDGTLSHVFSAESSDIRDEFMNALNVTMSGHKINVLYEGSLYFRGEDVKCWENAYFALTNDSLLAFKDEVACKEFKDSMYSTEQFYNEAFDAVIVQNIAMDEIEIEKTDYLEIDNDDNLAWLELLKIFMIKTNAAIWYFATEEATEYLSWYQSLLSLKPNDVKRNKLFLDTGTKSNTIIHRQRSNDITDTKQVQNALAPTEALFLMHINTDLCALDESLDRQIQNETETDALPKTIPKMDKRISMKAMMAVSLDSKPNKIHTARSQSVQFTPFSEKELQLMIDTENDIDDSYKDSLENNENEDRKSESNDDDDYVYTTDSDQTSESDRDCLESTTNVSVYYRKRKETEMHYIMDDDDDY